MTFFSFFPGPSGRRADQPVLRGAKPLGVVGLFRAVIRFFRPGGLGDESNIRNSIGGFGIYGDVNPGFVNPGLIKWGGLPFSLGNQGFSGIPQLINRLFINLGVPLVESC